MEGRGARVEGTMNISTPSRMRFISTPSRESSTNSCSASRRLQSEVMNMMMSEDSGISAFPGSDLFFWVGTIEGIKGTVYEGLTYKLSICFPMDYPYNPPHVKFETPCFHPNVDQHGNICLDILQDKWSSAYDCRTVLLSIQSLLGDPNNESPLNVCAAALWDNREEFKKLMLKEYHGGG